MRPIILAVSLFLVLFVANALPASSIESADGKRESVSLETATKSALAWVERPAGYAIRGMRVTFIPNGIALLKGYRGTVPSDVKAGRAYWQVTFDYYKLESMVMEFQGAIIIDALTGERVNYP